MAILSFVKKKSVWPKKSRSHPKFEFFDRFPGLYTPKGNKKNYVSNYILKNQNDDTP